MDRCDANSEGIQLPPMDAMRLLARQEAVASIRDHLELCPLVSLHVEDRLREVEITVGRLIGFMVGSGLLGGVAGGIAGKLFGHG
jgi:hypothetical protein